MSPVLTAESRPLTAKVEAIDETGTRIPTAIACEHPLTVYLDKRELVTLMTLGDSPEYLVLGWLRNQGLVSEIDTLASVQVDWETGSAAVTTRSLARSGTPCWESSAAQALASRLTHRTVTTGCGQGTVYGDLMEHIDSIRLSTTARLTQTSIRTVLESVRKHESIYKLAGAVHGCALFSNPPDGEPVLLQFVEDVGRHNAVDAIAGRMWADGTVGSDKIFYTTGRLTSEMVMKCAQMGIPILLSRSGLTGLGHEIAQRVGITLIGRCQGRHYLVFTGAQRVIAPGMALPDV